MRNYTELKAFQLSDAVVLLRLKGISKVDMALWSAAHLDVSKDYAILREEMNRDEHFQEIRFKNLIHGFQGHRRHWKPTDRERLVLSRALLKDDHIAAAAIAARCFESIVHQIARRLNVHAGTPKRGQTEFSALIDKLANQRELRDFPLLQWREYRGKAVHEIRSPIEASEAAELVTGIERLIVQLQKLPGN